MPVELNIERTSNSRPSVMLAVATKLLSVKVLFAKASVKLRGLSGFAAVLMPIRPAFVPTIPTLEPRNPVMLLSITYSAGKQNNCGPLGSQKDNLYVSDFCEAYTGFTTVTLKRSGLVQKMRALFTGESADCGRICAQRRTCISRESGAKVDSSMLRDIFARPLYPVGGPCKQPHAEITPLLHHDHPLQLSGVGELKRA